MRRRVYYAHCVALYGTPQENRDLNTLTALGFEVVNPNSLEIKAQVEAVKRCYGERSNLNHLLSLEMRHRLHNYRDDGEAVMMEVFKPLFNNNLDALAFRALPHGAIPAGVAKEIDWAVEADLAIFELPAQLLTRTMSVEATREYLHQIGQR